MSISPKVNKFVKHLIERYQYKRFDDLCFSDQCDFAALLMDDAGKNAEHECITDSNDLDKIIFTVKQSLFNNIDDEDFVYTLKECVVSYYSYKMEEIFDEVLEDCKHDRFPKTNKFNEVIYANT